MCPFETKIRDFLCLFCHDVWIIFCGSTHDGQANILCWGEKIKKARGTHSKFGEFLSVAKSFIGSKKNNKAELHNFKRAFAFLATEIWVLFLRLVIRKCCWTTMTTMNVSFFFDLSPLCNWLPASLVILKENILAAEKRRRSSFALCVKHPFSLSDNRH